MPQPPRGSAPEREGAQRGVPTRRGFATGVNPDQLSASSAGSGRRARRARPPHPVRGGVAPRPAEPRLRGAGRDPGSVSTSRRLGSRPHGPSAKAWSSVPLRTARLDGDGPDHPAGPQPTDEEHGETNGERHGSRRFGVEVPRRDTDRDRHEGAGQGEGGEDSHRGSRPGHHGGDALSDRPASTDNIGHRRHRGCQWRTQRLAERPGRRDQAEVVGPQRLRVGGPHGSDGLAALRGQAQCVCRPATAPDDPPPPRIDPPRPLHPHPPLDPPRPPSDPPRPPSDPPETPDGPLVVPPSEKGLEAISRSAVAGGSPARSAGARASRRSSASASASTGDPRGRPGRLASAVPPTSPEAAGGRGAADSTSGLFPSARNTNQVATASSSATTSAVTTTPRWPRSTWRHLSYPEAPKVAATLGRRASRLDRSRGRPTPRVARRDLEPPRRSSRPDAAPPPPRSGGRRAPRRPRR